MKLKVYTFDSEIGSFDLNGNSLDSISSSGKSFTNVAPVLSPTDAEASEMLYQLAVPARLSQALCDFGPS